MHCCVCDVSIPQKVDCCKYCIVLFAQWHVFHIVYVIQACSSELYIAVTIAKILWSFLVKKRSLCVSMYIKYVCPEVYFSCDSPRKKWPTETGIELYEWQGRLSLVPCSVSATTLPQPAPHTGLQPPQEGHIFGCGLNDMYVTIIWAPGPILATSRLPSSPHDNCGRSLHCLRCYVITFSPCLKLNVSLKSPSANIYYNGWYQCNSPLCQLALGGRFWALKYLRELRSGRDDHIQIPQVYCCTLLQCAEASAWLMQWLAVHSRKGQTWVWVWTPERERERERERESFASTPWCWSHDVTT